MHLGWNLISRSKTNEFLTCAFSWTFKTSAINRQNRIETWMVPNGACFLLPDYFKDDDYSRRKPILILPMSKDRPFKETGDYLHAYAMAGFSATISTVCIRIKFYEILFVNFQIIGSGQHFSGCPRI